MKKGPNWFAAKICHDKDLASQLSKNFAMDLGSRM
jgi:hypothetical protein